MLVARLLLTGDAKPKQGSRRAKVIAVRPLDRSRAALYWLIPVAIATIAITAAFHFDLAVRHFIAQRQGALGKNIMVDIGRFGDWLEHFALGLVLASIAWWRGSKKMDAHLLSHANCFGHCRHGRADHQVCHWSREAVCEI